MPGGRAPRAMPKPLTGGAGALPSPSASDAGDVVADSGCAASGFDSVGVGSAGALDFFAPGRLAPAAMPSPLTGAGSALAWSGAAFGGWVTSVGGGDASAAGAASAAFFAPGRLVPAAMPSPLTGAASAGFCGVSVGFAGAEAAGAAAFAPGRFAPPAMPSPVTGLASLSPVLRRSRGRLRGRGRVLRRRPAPRASPQASSSAAT